MSGLVVPLLASPRCRAPRWVAALLLASALPCVAAAQAAAPLPGEFDAWAPPPAAVDPPPVPLSAPPPPAPESPPPAAERPPITVEPLPTPQPAPPRVATKPRETCPQGPGARAFLRTGLPVWAGGAMVGGALGAATLATVGLLATAAVYFVVNRDLVTVREEQLPSLFFVVLAGVGLGAAAGAVAGGVTAPYVSRLGVFQPPCLDEPGSDPTRRQVGTHP